VAGRIIWAWLLTIPAAALVGAAVTYALRLCGALI
jgi:phosphate/sulfate permease